MNKIALPFAGMRILSEDDAWYAVVQEPDKWNVISIWSGGGGKHGNAQPTLEQAKSLCQHRFHDINRLGDGLILCDKNHVLDILKFARSKYNEPLIVHCHAGISRSSAIALLILIDYYKDVMPEGLIEHCLHVLIRVKPAHLILPNKHIVGLGMRLIARSIDEEIQWNRDFYNSSIVRKLYG